MAITNAVPNPEKDYPVAVIRESIVPPTQFVTTNGTSLPTLTVFEFIPLFTTGSKGAILDFISFRCDTRGSSGDDMTIRYVADGTTPDNTGQAVTNTLGTYVNTAGDSIADTKQVFTVNPSYARIPANSLVFADISNSDNATAIALGGLVFDVGRRVLTN